MPINIYNEEDCAADLAVIGLGPAGLASALQTKIELHRQDPSI